MVMNAVGPIGGSFEITGRMDGHLFTEDFDAGGGRGQPAPGKIGVIEAKIVVVLGPIGRGGGKKFDEAREAELLKGIET